MGDVATTTATILSVLFFRVTGINIDGFVGIGVALVVMWAGIGIAKDTLEPLIGEAVPQETFDEITRFVESYDALSEHTICWYIITDRDGAWRPSMRKCQMT